MRLREHMKNSADLGGCYPLRPKAEVDNTLLEHSTPLKIHCSYGSVCLFVFAPSLLVSFNP